MDCKIINKPIQESANTIKTTIAKSFEDAGTTFVQNFEKAIAPMEGEAKDALVDFFNKAYKDLTSSTEKGIPAMVKGLGELLETNRQQFAQTDHSIAMKIQEANKG